jgi:putative heme degradation protein
MATINLTEGTHIHKSSERIKLEDIRKALMVFTGNDGCVQYNTEVITLLCNQIEEVEREV